MKEKCTLRGKNYERVYERKEKEKTGKICKAR
jgi:hypothetical protein